MDSWTATRSKFNKNKISWIKQSSKLKIFGLTSKFQLPEGFLGRAFCPSIRSKSTSLTKSPLKFVAKLWSYFWVANLERFRYFSNQFGKYLSLAENSPAKNNSCGKLRPWKNTRTIQPELFPDDLLPRRLCHLFNPSLLNWAFENRESLHCIEENREFKTIFLVSHDLGMEKLRRFEWRQPLLLRTVECTLLTRQILSWLSIVLSSR